MTPMYQRKEERVRVLEGHLVLHKPLTKFTIYGKT